MSPGRPVNSKTRRWTPSILVPASSSCWRRSSASSARDNSANQSRLLTVDLRNWREAHVGLGGSKVMRAGDHQRAASSRTHITQGGKQAHGPQRGVRSCRPRCATGTLVRSSARSAGCNSRFRRRGWLRASLRDAPPLFRSRKSNGCPRTPPWADTHTRRSARVTSPGPARYGAPVRRRRPSDSATRRTACSARTPAMAAGVSEYPWSLTQLATLLD